MARATVWGGADVSEYAAAIGVLLCDRDSGVAVGVCDQLLALCAADPD